MGKLPGFTKQGVRDLNGIPGKSLVIAPTEMHHEKEEFVATVDPKYFEPSVIGDLLYDWVTEDVQKEFPQAKCEEEDDWIKGHRTSVEIPGTSTWTWYCFLVKTGMAVISFRFQVDMMSGVGEDQGKTKALLEAVMDEVKPGWRKRAAKRKSDERR